jgi:Rieske Fe-S protein
MAENDMSGARHQPHTTGPNRRQMLDWLLSLGTGGLLGILLYPIARYVIPPEQPEAASNAIAAGKVKDFPPNTGKIVRFGERPAIIVHLATGEFRAFSASCTHLGCTVQYRADREQIWCACHNGAFDLAGKNVSGPPPRPLDGFDVAVRGDDVVVSKRA